MARIFRFKVDEQTEVILRRLCLQTGLSESEVIRMGIRQLAPVMPAGGKARVIGVGRFAFGRGGDLASNKAHLEAFGKK